MEMVNAKRDTIQAKENLAQERLSPKISRQQHDRKRLL